jgi:hypothetical protein
MIKRLFPAIVACLVPACLSGQSTLKVNEVSTAATSWIEIINLGASPVNMTGYKIRFGGNSGLSFVQGVYTIGAVTLNTNQVLVITEDPSATVPSVPAGVFKAYCGMSLPWATTPSTGANGVVCLNTPGDVGLDRMKWGNPLQDMSTYGSPWTSTISPTAAVMLRGSPVDTDGPADWSFSATGSPGAANPGEANVVSMQLTTSGGGSITLNVTTLGPPLPSAELYNLVSFQTQTPTGSGPLFGIGADALVQATYGYPFHTNLDVNGNFSISGGPGTLPVGTHLEGISIVLQGGAIARISSVAVITL